MLDTKLQPTNTMKSKDKSSEQRFGHMNATNRNSYLIIVSLLTETEPNPCLQKNSNRAEPLRWAEPEQDRTPALRVLIHL